MVWGFGDHTVDRPQHSLPHCSRALHSAGVPTNESLDTMAVLLPPGLPGQPTGLHPGYASSAFAEHQDTNHLEEKRHQLGRIRAGGRRPACRLKARRCAAYRHRYLRARPRRSPWPWILARLGRPGGAGQLPGLPRQTDSGGTPCTQALCDLRDQGGWLTRSAPRPASPRF